VIACLTQQAVDSVSGESVLGSNLLFCRQASQARPSKNNCVAIQSSINLRANCPIKLQAKHYLAPLSLANPKAVSKIILQVMKVNNLKIPVLPETAESIFQVRILKALYRIMERKAYKRQ